MKMIEPFLRPVEVTALRPTQMTVGMSEVERKRRLWRDHSERDGPEFLGRHMLPVVLGPDERHWLIDHHHLALALHQEGAGHVLVNIVADLRVLKRQAFLVFMDNRNWLHPYDAQGKRQPAKDLPKNIADLGDDPFRSLAGALRRAGGYAKVPTPYSEFLWADFLRRRISAEKLAKNPEAALTKALSIACDKDADFLPGWCGAQD
ncbi:ParB-like protein [Novosphingobium sp. P6W]|uniref:ParB-like protein n=1 Tax=Novosphingobium sp. P6W TaxID=1609758 RepID=UPI0005C324D4|nr:ParB-like protein [Novosphingobium sp. P6W]KIS30675.1 chromosome partitioning protein ParB [Novosphingobium sp. P6W]